MSAVAGSSALGGASRCSRGRSRPERRTNDAPLADRDGTGLGRSLAGAARTGRNRRCLWWSPCQTAPRKTMRSSMRIASAASFAVSLCSTFAGSAASRIGIPLNCSHGPGGQQQNVTIAAPAGVVEGATYKVRVDGANSGKISHTGLNYIFDMSYEWLVPAGTRYVEGSARIVPNTGTENVRPGARVTQAQGVITMVLPAHVDDGANYTPTAFEFELAVVAPAGSTITQAFSRYGVMANAFLVGNVKTVCEPIPKPFPVAATRIEPANK
jgi:hypothetical protein